MGLQVRTITGTLDRRIITALITSTEYCNQALPMLRGDYFESKYGAVLFEWCRDYFRLYKQAPGKMITNIYRDNRDGLQEAERDVIKELLQSLSEDFSSNGLNVEYLSAQTAKMVRRRSVEVLSDKLQQMVETGRIDKAEKEIELYKKTLQVSSGFFDPFSVDAMREALEEEDADVIFQLPGKIGKMAGPHQRNELSAVLAPMKRGKSFMLQEFALQAVLNNKRVVFFSLEMSRKQMQRRLAKRITAMAEIGEGDWVYPCFDCKHNQTGTCKKEERVNRVPLLVEGSNEKPPYHPSMKYKPCIVCRGKKGFEVASWYVLKHRGRLHMKKAIAKARSMKTMYGDNIRIRSYPAYSANVATLKAELDMLEYVEGFVPDCIIVDYADILKPEDTRLNEKRDRLDETWKMLKNLGDERNCHVVTASQGNRKSIDKKTMSQTDIAEDIRKLAHVNMMYALSQTQNEKAEGVMRISMVAERERDFNEATYALVLQQRSLSQVLLDSEVVYPSGRSTDLFSQPWDWSKEEG